jgi:predicted dehydrogenase
MKVGIVGLGAIAATHLEVLGELDGIEVVSAVDPDPEAAARVATSTRRFTELESALEECPADLFVVATPSRSHVALASHLLTHTSAQVLVEKPLTHDLSSLISLSAAVREAGAGQRLFTAHHFGFSPEVRWSADMLRSHPEWGPVGWIDSVFHDPYVGMPAHQQDSYVSPWTDSGPNQLSVVARLIDLDDLRLLERAEGDLTSWVHGTFGREGEGRLTLAASWRAAGTSKQTRVETVEGVVLWLDHTAMTVHVTLGSMLLATRQDPGELSRKVAHYRPLYETILSGQPDDILRLEAAERITTLLYS